MVTANGQICEEVPLLRVRLWEPVRAEAPLEWVQAKPIIDGFASVVPSFLLDSATYAVWPRAARVFSLSNVTDLTAIPRKQIVRMDALLSWFRMAVLHQLSADDNERLLLLHAWLVTRKVMLGRSVSAVRIAPQMSSCSANAL